MSRVGNFRPNDSFRTDPRTDSFFRRSVRRFLGRSSSDLPPPGDGDISLVFVNRSADRFNADVSTGFNDTNLNRSRIRERSQERQLRRQNSRRANSPAANQRIRKR